MIIGILILGITGLLIMACGIIGIKDKENWIDKSMIVIGITLIVSDLFLYKESVVLFLVTLLLGIIFLFANMLIIHNKLIKEFHRYNDKKTDYYPQN